jgi:hypothetical protein
VILGGAANDMVVYQYDVVNRLTKEQRSGTANDQPLEYWQDQSYNLTKSAKATELTFRYNGPASSAAELRHS